MQSTRRGELHIDGAAFPGRPSHFMVKAAESGSIANGPADSVAPDGPAALPAPVDFEPRGHLPFPVVGIGASAACDGQVLVSSDMLGVFDWTPKFVRKYADLRGEIDRAVETYAADVRARRFPAEVETYFSKKLATP